jgi:hypothetical protein
VNLVPVLIAKEAEFKDQKPWPHYAPYLQNISLLLDDKAMSNDQVCLLRARSFSP